MNEKIRGHVKQFCGKKGWNCETDGDIWETVIDGGKEIYSEVIGSRRWWDDVFYVVELDGMLIGYDGIHTTGDNETGWEPDYNSLCEVERKEVAKVVVTYVPKK